MNIFHVFHECLSTQAYLLANGTAARIWPSHKRGVLMQEKAVWWFYHTVFIEQFAPTLLLWVRRDDSVANPFPHILQWNGLFFNLSSCDSWLRKCCCKLESWMKARPQSGTWHLYGRSPENRCKRNILGMSDSFDTCMQPGVLLNMGKLFESPVTVWALIWLFSCMNTDVLDQLMIWREGF